MAELFAFCISFLLSLLLARVVNGRATDRDPTRPAVPCVGGFAILGTLLTLRIWFDVELPVRAAVLAVLVGAIDDRWPRPPLSKLLLQVVVGLALAVDQGQSDPFQVLTTVGLVLIATNLANTFDHADGLLTGLLLLAPGGPLVVRAAALGFLPHNILPRSAGGSPRAYLGDAGSHLVGVLLLVSFQPLCFLVPALDLGRVLILRARAHEPLWRGDRRHLGHLLADRGWPPWLALMALLPTFGGWEPNRAAPASALIFLFLCLLPRRGCARGTLGG